MKTIIIFIEAVSFAHMTRSITLAQKLSELGHEIIVACSMNELIKLPKISLPSYITYVDLYSTTPKHFNRFLNWGIPFISYKKISSAIEQEVQIIDRFKPDIIIGDFRLSLLISTRKRQIIYINLCNAYWVEDKDLYKSFVPHTSYEYMIGKSICKRVIPLCSEKSINFTLSIFNYFFKENGLRQINNIGELYTSGDYRFFVDSNELYQNSLNENNSFFTGPLLFDSKTELPECVNKFISSRNPKILLTLGSTGDNNYLNYLLRKVLPKLPYNFLVISPFFSNSYKFKAENISLVPFLNLDLISKYLDAAITNGGSGGTYHMLGNGVPVLCVSKNYDQFLFSSVVEKNNLGLMIKSGLHSVSEFNIKIKLLLGNNDFKVKIGKTTFQGQWNQINNLIGSVL